MQNKLLVRAKGVSLHYPILHSSSKSLRGMLANRFLAKARHGHPVEFAALRDVNFEVFAGDRVAVVGANGAGKTTLLRTISGIYAPDKGRLECFGSVLPLFGSLPGMSGDATGYENIMLAAYSMGMLRKDLPALMTDVEEFCQLGEFLSMPIKSYSAGMAARLNFAIATGMSADIFVMDEFSFAAGDRFFKERARERARGQLDRAQAVFVASHDDQLLLTICNKAIYLSDGHLLAFGPIEEVLGTYGKATR